MSVSLAFFRSSSFLIRVADGKIFRERTFVFGFRYWSCVFSLVFCLGFCFIICRLAPEYVQKILFMSGFLFLGVRSPFLWCSVVVVFVSLFACFFLSRDTAQVVTGQTPHCTLWSCFFLSPPHLVYHPFWPCC